MSPIPKRITSRQSSEVMRRLVNCLPAATFEMETFCRLTGVEVSSKVPTAAVETGLRSRLLVNPHFVAKYCESDEHLFLLVMHELWHIILAHTRMYPRATMAHNIAFDAIINAGLSRQFPGPEYRGFFKSINPIDDFPQILLRPPEGWPDNPIYPEGVGPAGTKSAMMRLYPPGNDKSVTPPFYDEILDLLRQYARENGYDWGEIILLGDHDNPDQEGKALDDPVLKEAMKRVVKRWPKGQIGGRRDRGKGGEAEKLFADLEHSAEQARRVFANTLRRCLNPGRGRQRRKAKMSIPGMAGISVLPNARDRMAPAKRILGAPTTLWGQPGETRARVPDVPGKAYIYLDVSGSMGDILPRLLSLIVPWVANGHADVFQFSTIVEPLSLAELKQGRINTTGGTDINCVIEHMLEAKPAVRRALILTDGYTGEPDNELIQRVRDNNIRMHVVLPADDSSPEDLQEIATSLVTLPSIYPGSSI